jgi:hypothetical protein
MSIRKNKILSNTNIKSLRSKNLYIINAENLNDQFYKCVHGFFYVDPIYNIFYHECKLKQKMVYEMCLNCPKFKEKKPIKLKKGE